MSPIIRYKEFTPTVASTTFVAPSASIIGHVAIGEGSGVFYGAVIRGDCESISIGVGSNVQDNAVLHADAGSPCRVGDNVSIGHGAVVHGCLVEDTCLIGMNATVMNGARVGKNSLIAAGSVVLEGTIIPEGSLVAGIPAKIRRQLTALEIAGLMRNAEIYQQLAQDHRSTSTL